MDMELDGLERSKAVEELTTTFYDIMVQIEYRIIRLLV